MVGTLTMPPEIAAAIAAAMGGVRPLVRESENRHGGYRFASIDAFLRAVGPVCSEHGLFILMHEAEIEVTPGRGEGKAGLLRAAYDLTLCHRSGATWGPIRRNVTVVASGAQAYGAAQSFVLKQFLRGLLMIPTGEQDDPDFAAAADLAPHRARSADEEAAAERLDHWAESLSTAPTIEALNAVAAEMKAATDIPGAALRRLRSLYADRARALRAAPPAPPADDVPGREAS